jgi:pseudouridine-5'-phosphate glycosidase
MNSDLSDVLKYSDEVAAALASGSPIVALESTIISHGLPRPTNLDIAREVEAIVREHGATPATIAVIDGSVHIGLSDAELVTIATRDNILKASSRDLAIAVAFGKSAATTVAPLTVTPSAVESAIVWPSTVATSPSVTSAAMTFPATT